ncbi:DUF4349 domain-containing protein [Streptomyces adustus]|uniref:DUF4349 domain-containing protein n=1 Tax=Streptomyces adustus TaxID=1609272 RepID=UPI003723998B
MRAPHPAPRSARRSAPPSVRRSARTLAGVLLVSALALTGCSAGADDKSAGASDAKAAAGPEAQTDTGSQARAGAADSSGSGSGSGSGRTKTDTPPVLSNSHIIRTATLTVQVKDAAKALDSARTTTENAGGYVGDETTTRDADSGETTRVVLRVPVERYAEVLAGLEGTGKLLERTAKAQDVTDQVVDVDSRVKSQRASVARIRELMDRAAKLSDVVTLEGELSSREADLESLLAQQASLKDRTSMATITLSLFEKPVPKPEKKDEDPGFVDALAGGWGAFVTMLRWIAVAFGAALPFAAVAALLVLAWLRLIRPRRRNRTAPEGPGLTGPGRNGPALNGPDQH